MGRESHFLFPGLSLTSPPLASFSLHPHHPLTGKPLSSSPFFPLLTLLCLFSTSGSDATGGKQNQSDGGDDGTRKSSDTYAPLSPDPSPTGSRVPTQSQPSSSTSQDGEKSGDEIVIIASGSGSASPENKNASRSKKGGGKKGWRKDERPEIGRFFSATAKERSWTSSRKQEVDFRYRDKDNRCIWVMTQSKETDTHIFNRQKHYIPCLSI